MSKEKEKTVTMKCPECSSAYISGFVPGFWVSLDKEGYDAEPSLNDQVESNTELSEKRLCVDCSYEWEAE